MGVRERGREGGSEGETEKERGRERGKNGGRKGCSIPARALACAVCTWYLLDLLRAATLNSPSFGRGSGKRKVCAGVS